MENGEKVAEKKTVPNSAHSDKTSDMKRNAYIC